MPKKDFDVFKDDAYKLKTVFFHSRKKYSMKGEVALQLIGHFALVAAMEDGEDSAGRRALKLQSPDQVVSRCCEISDKLIDEFEKRGWIVEIPAYEDILGVEEVQK